MYLKYVLLSLIIYAADGSAIIATVSSTAKTEVVSSTTSSTTGTVEPRPYRNSLDFQSQLIAALSKTDALPSRGLATITGKIGTGEFITAANPFLHAKYLYAASLLGSSGGLSSYAVEPTISQIGVNYPHPKETITIGPSTFIGVATYTGAVLPGSPTNIGPQSRDIQSASCTIDSGSTAVCSYAYFARGGGTSALNLGNSPPIRMTAAQFNTLEVLQGSAVTTSRETSMSATPTSSQGTSGTGSATAATSTSGGTSLSFNSEIGNAMIMAAVLFHVSA